MTAEVRDATPTTRLPLVIYVLALGLFLMGTTEFVVAGILPDMAADMNVSISEAGLSITVFAVGMIIGAPTMALATLRLQQRLTLVASLVVFALGHVIVAIAPSFAILLAARFITALATGAFWAVAAVVATRVAGLGAASRAVGVVNAGGMLATVLGVPLGAFAGQILGWRGTFWSLALLAIIAVLPVVRNVPANDTSNQNVSVRHELTALRSGRLWLALAGCAGATGGVLAAYSYIAPLLTDQSGFSPQTVPLLLAAFGIGSLIGSLVGGRLGDWAPHATTIIAPIVTIALLVLLIFTADIAWLTAISVTLLGFFGLGANPVLISLTIRYAQHAPTLGSSLSVAAFNTGTAVASWVGGIALASQLATTGPLIIGAAIAALALLPVTILAARKRAA